MRLLVIDLCSGLDGWTQAFIERGHDCVGIEKEASLKPVIEGDVRQMEGRARALLSALVEPGWMPDAILASPPCEGFSIATVSKMWEPQPDGSFKPKHSTARIGLEVLNACLGIISELQPQYWWLENPRAMMRRMPQLRGFRHAEITQCSYGRLAAKATDLWGRFPDTWLPRPFCNADHHNGVMDDKGDTYAVEQVGSGKEKRFALLSTVDGERIEVPKDGRVFLHGHEQALRVLNHEGLPCHEWSSRGFKTGTQGGGTSNERAKIPYELSRDVCISIEQALYRPAPFPILSRRPTRRISEVPR